MLSLIVVSCGSCTFSCLSVVMLGDLLLLFAEVHSSDNHSLYWLIGFVSHKRAAYFAFFFYDFFSVIFFFTYLFFLFFSSFLEKSFVVLGEYCND